MKLNASVKGMVLCVCVCVYVSEGKFHVIFGYMF